MRTLSEAGISQSLIVAALGTKAFHQGKPCGPYQDLDFRNFVNPILQVRGKVFRPEGELSFVEMCEIWSGHWHMANIHAPVEPVFANGTL